MRKKNERNTESPNSFINVNNFYNMRISHGQREIGEQKKKDLFNNKAFNKQKEAEKERENQLMAQMAKEREITEKNKARESIGSRGWI